MARATVLIVDDESAARYAQRRALEHAYRTVEAASVSEAREAIVRERADLVLLDLVMGEEGGLDFLRWMRANSHEQPVIVVSALDTARNAVEALRLGATDYLAKGFDVEELRARVKNLLRLANLERENVRLRERLISDGQFGAMLGSTPEMRRLFEMAARVAETDATVLILGESGTGKDLLAQEIHARSSRAGRSYVAVNCAALPENLIESELFGYEKGAFTGAAQQKKGKFELANGGTLFLDEIGDMNPLTQAKVLRALENRVIERLGGTQTIPVDVRVISATHRNLKEEVVAGRFREDLYYRLRVVTLDVPPLRDRKEDVPLLADAFLKLHNARLAQSNRSGAVAAATKPLKFARDTMETLLRYDWPGNVRELKNATERGFIFANGAEILPADLPAEIAGGSPVAGRAPASDSSALSEADFRDAKRKFEIAYITRQLERNNWNISRTALAIGLHRQSLQEKLRELGISRNGKKSDA